MDEDLPAQREANKHSKLRAFIWPDWKQRKRIIHVQAWVFLVLAYGLILPAWWLPQDFKNGTEAYVAVRWFFFMVEVFTHHIGLLLLVIAAVAAWRRCRWLAGAALPLMLLTAGPLLWSYVPLPARPKGSPAFRVMSVNLLYINGETSAMVDEIRQADPDLLVIQEYAHHWHGVLERELADAYPHRFAKPQDDAFGSAIYSRLPFVEEPTLMYALGPSELPQVRAVVDAGGRHVAVYNIHLLPAVNLEYVIARHGQFAALLEALKNEPLPLVLMGDFNFTEETPFARALHRAGVNDAHDITGYGLGATWPVHGFMRYIPIPGFRIDHLYVGDNLTCTAIQTGVGRGSDHRPLIATLGWNITQR